MDFRKEYEKWLASPALSAAEHAELEPIRDDAGEIEARFYGPLEFGTAGLRGTMAVGLHNMNIHVIRWATQGFCQIIAEGGEEAKRRGVAICMDCRNHSMEFARAAAEVCAANGIHVRIFDALRPTPELSFAVRHYGATAGINITASHNPKEYNGYKVYWSDGAQLPPQHADGHRKADGARSTSSPASRPAITTRPSRRPHRDLGDDTDEALHGRSLPRSSTGPRWPGWRTPSSSSTRPSTAAATSWCRRR
jgi:phosphoglucomutase